MAVKIALPPDAGARREAAITGTNPMQGARSANLSPALADEMQMDMLAKGVVVTGVARTVRWRRALAFSRATSCARSMARRIANVAELKRALHAEQGWELSIQRGNQVLQLSVQVNVSGRLSRRREAAAMRGRLSITLP